MHVRLRASPELRARLADLRTELSRGGVQALIAAQGGADAPRAMPGAPEQADVVLELELRAASGLQGTAAAEAVAVLARAEPRDALVAAPGEPPRSLSRLARGVRVGAFGPYRRALLLVHRPDVEVVELDEAPNARTLERAGIRWAVMGGSAARRAGLSGAVGEALEPGSWPTSPGQDGYVLVALGDDAPAAAEGTDTLDRNGAIHQVATMIDDHDARAAIAAELAVREALSVGPDAPLGALARPHGPLLRVRAMVADGAGRRLVRAEITARADDPVDAGRRVARILLDRGAGALLP